MSDEQIQPSSSSNKQTQFLMRFGQAIVSYGVLIYSTGTLILNIITALELANDNYAVITSTEMSAETEGLEIASVVIAAITWIFALISFVLMYIYFARKQFDQH
jgi:hypothetical protein